MGPQMEDNPGHYHKRRGALYSVELDGTVIKRLTDVSISNGMAWSSDNKKFYYVDTYKFAVESYDFDIVSGNLSESFYGHFLIVIRHTFCVQSSLLLYIVVIYRVGT